MTKDHATLDKIADYEQAVAQYADLLYRVSYHHCARPEDAEDAVQDTFIKLWQRIEPFENDEHCKAWLLRVAINRTHDLTRAAHNKNVALTDTIPEKEANDGEILALVRSLKDPYGTAIYLHYYEGYTAAEIGSILDAPANTVLSWLRRARKQLETLLQEDFAS